MTRPKKQQPDMQEINERYGTFLWGIANRYHTGMWDPTDVYQQLLMMAYSATVDGTLTMGDSDGEISRVKSFLISRAINIVRYEVRRQGAIVMKSNKGGIWGSHTMNRRPSDFRFSLEDYIVREDGIEIDPISTEQPEAIRFEIELIKELLFTRLDEQTATFIYELAFPSDKTIKIAMADQKVARKDRNLRMNIHELVVLPKHVALSLKDKLGRVLPKVTISRIRQRAKKGVCDDKNRTLDI
jgi:DNA-directed RNA polymerase specialized sigma24 family protein